ncbi:transposase [Kitasatospora sp. NPDC004669]|uniref:transposase n=1 Tax=Kitasatospora sp. NPDC004669 TaxID=3154555 RepID=UPI0033AF4D9A
MLHRPRPGLARRTAAAGRRPPRGGGPPRGHGRFAATDRRARSGPRRLRPRRSPRITALAVVAEVGDITRFPSARKLASWAGLTPTVRNSDRTVHHGHISEQGSPRLRWIMCEAAQTAKRHPVFAPGYQEMARRRGKKIATTAVARKLLARAYHVLREVNDQQTTPRRATATPPGAATRSG